MDRRTFQDHPCSIARSMDILGDWWAPLIIRECLYGVSRFDDLQGWLGIGRNMLSRRLSKLVEQGVLAKKAYSERPTRYEYQLTDKGYDAAKVLLAMMPFGEEWLFDGKRPIQIYSRKTGQRVKPVVVDELTGEPLDPRQLFAGPGPAFPRSQAVRRQRFEEYFRRDVADDPE